MMPTSVSPHLGGPRRLFGLVALLAQLACYDDAGPPGAASARSSVGGGGQAGTPAGRGGGPVAGAAGAGAGAPTGKGGGSVAGAAGAPGSGGAGGGLDAGGYHSASPTVGTSPPPTAGYGGGSHAGGSSIGPKYAGYPPRDIARPIITEQRGDLSYVLTRIGGLMVVDTGAAKPALVGQRRFIGEPSRLYVRDTTGIAAFTSWQASKADQADLGSLPRDPRSHLVAMDLADPQALSVLAEVDLPGDLIDSRLVGNVLYTVAYESGCSLCTSGDATVLTAWDVAAPITFTALDRLVLPNTSNDVDVQAGWSVMMAEGSMYFSAAAPLTGPSMGPRGSLLRRVPFGVPLAGSPPLAIPGLVDRRWQLSERAGTLRVVSRSDKQVNDAPRVQLFDVTQPGLTPLVALELKELSSDAWSIAFDGDHAYVVGASQQLFPIDLTDRLAPKVRAPLPGFGSVLALRSDGDRLLVVGHASAVPQRLSVSLLDVQDRAHPKLSARVSFGVGTSLPDEAEVRAIREGVFYRPSDGLLAVPVGPAVPGDPTADCAPTPPGLALFDVGQTTLTSLGTARADALPSAIVARDERLLAISSASVQTFAAPNLTAPTLIGELALSRRVRAVFPYGPARDRLARTAVDPLTQATFLELTQPTDPEAAEPAGRVEIETVEEAGLSCKRGWAATAVPISAGSRLHFAAPAGKDLSYFTKGKGPLSPSLYRFVSLDVSDASAPTILSDHTLDVGPPAFEADGYVWFSGAPASGPGALVDGSATHVALGETFVALRGRANGTGELTWVERSLEVFDLAHAPAPVHAATVPLPPANGRTGLLARGTVVWSSHWQHQPDGRVKIYLDRVDLADPAHPVILPSRNVPGTLLGIDGEGRALTLDYQEEALPGVEKASCYPGGVVAGVPTSKTSRLRFDPQTGACLRMSRTFNLLSLADETAVLASLPVPESFSADVGVRITDSHVFSAVTGDAGGLDAYALRFDGGGLEVSVTALPPEQTTTWRGRWGVLAAEGRRGLYMSDWYSLPKIHLFDATNAKAPTFGPLATLSDNLGDCYLEGGRLVCAFQDTGVQIVPLPAAP